MHRPQTTDPVGDLHEIEAPQTLEPTEEVPALARFALEARTEELHLLYKAVSHFLSGRDYDLDELSQAAKIYGVLEREVQRRLREAAWPKGEEDELPF